MKKFGNVCYILGIVIAIGLSTRVLPQELDSSHSQSGTEITCPCWGYVEPSCNAVLGCISGSYKLPQCNYLFSNQNYREDGVSKKGNCTGSDGCMVPTTGDLTSVGCGG